jgi:hypothetical protein
MNSTTTVAATTAVSLTTVQVAQAVSWAASGFPAPMPESVSYTLASVAIIAAHVAYLAVLRWLNRTP